MLHLSHRPPQIMAEYKYSQLENVAVDIVDDAITLNMRTRNAEEQRRFNFETTQKEDIANLIASYSPVHSNWQRVGEAKTKLVSVSVVTSLVLDLICYKTIFFPFPSSPLTPTPLTLRSMLRRRTERSCGRRCGCVGRPLLWSTGCSRSPHRQATSSQPRSGGWCNSAHTVTL